MCSPPKFLKRRIALLGATGSIGESALRVLAVHQDQLELVSIAAQYNHRRLAEIARAFRVRHVGIFDNAAFNEAKAGGQFAPDIRLYGGLAGLTELATMPEADVVLVAVAGTTALKPTLAAIAAQKTIALASKEILVLAGKFVMAAARASGKPLLPIDSEHNAIFQCLERRPTAEVSRVVLTASGGAFCNWPLKKLAQAKPADALKHPNWSMGPKITVDSATLANKGLELIEAQWLFGLRAEQCEAVLHAKSIVHCLVELTDGSFLTQLCPPSMTFPIQHALFHPVRASRPTEAGLDLSRALTLDFKPADETRFPCLRLAKQAMRTGGAAPAIFNAANEIAVAAFLGGRIPFLAISEIIAHTLGSLSSCDPTTLQEALAIDTEARRLASQFFV